MPLTSDQAVRPRSFPKSQQSSALGGHAAGGKGRRKAMAGQLPRHMHTYPGTCHTRSGLVVPDHPQQPAHVPRRRPGRPARVKCSRRSHAGLDGVTISDRRPCGNKTSSPLGRARDGFDNSAGLGAAGSSSPDRRPFRSTSSTAPLRPDWARAADRGRGIPSSAWLSTASRSGPATNRPAAFGRSSGSRAVGSSRYRSCSSA
jgi:hypothetical protein